MKPNINKFSASILLGLLLLFFQNPAQKSAHAFAPVVTTKPASTTSSDVWSTLKENCFPSRDALYASSPFFSFKRSECNRSIRLFSSGGTSAEKENLPQDLYPPLSREEVSNWLSSVEIYALMTSGEDGTGEKIHLLYGPDGSAVTYFFISLEAANTMASQLKEIGGIDLNITSLSLGKVWFGLLDKEGADRVEGVDYRLVPDPRDLNGAKILLAESTIADGSCSFVSPFNEIPTFLDVRMRIPGSEVVDDKPAEQLPVYLRLQNIMQASENMNKAQDTSPELSSAAINVADLNDLVKQMQQESTIDFRRSVLIPPTDMQ